MNTAFELFPDSAAARGEGESKGMKDEQASNEQIMFPAVMRGVH